MSELVSIIIPTVHLNGTSQEELLNQLNEVSHALDSVLRTLHQATPNERDYYPQGPTMFTRALEYHRRRVSAVRRLHAEIIAIAQGIGEQSP